MSGTITESASAIHAAATARMKFIAENRERIVEAFLAETGLQPSECEQVERNMGDGLILFHVQRRTA